MKNVCLIIEYDGTHFNGFQKQPNPEVKTIQGEIERAIKEITGEEVKTIASGRTDAGVSAEEQYINFLSETDIPIERLKFALNSKLPEEISVKESFLANEKFHARFSATKRSYRFRILNAPIKSALRRNCVFHFSLPLDFDAMEKAWLTLRGKHDFTAFGKSDSDRKDMTCEIFDTSCYKNGDELVFFITASSFLRGMVRLLIGTTIFIGQGKLQPEELMDIVIKKDRSRVGFSAGATGLSLIKIEYPELEKL